MPKSNDITHLNTNLVNSYNTLAIMMAPLQPQDAPSDLHNAIAQQAILSIHGVIITYLGDRKSFSTDYNGMAAKALLHFMTTPKTIPPFDSHHSDHIDCACLAFGQIASLIKNQPVASADEKIAKEIRRQRLVQAKNLLGIAYKGF